MDDGEVWTVAGMTGKRNPRCHEYMEVDFNSGRGG
jgi:hypothetical protein